MRAILAKFSAYLRQNSILVLFLRNNMDFFDLMTIHCHDFKDMTIGFELLTIFRQTAKVE